MTTYEILLMLDPELADARQDDLIARVREQTESSGGTWRSHDAWGRRRLAYPILKKNEGVYHLVVFEASAEALDEITRVLKIDDAVMRHLAVKHVEGSSTRAPRDETPVPAQAPTYDAAPTAETDAELETDAEPEADADADAEPEAAAVTAAEYPDTNTRSDEE